MHHAAISTATIDCVEVLARQYTIEEAAALRATRSSARVRRRRGGCLQHAVLELRLLGKEYDHAEECRRGGEVGQELPQEGHLGGDRRQRQSDGDVHLRVGSARLRGLGVWAELKVSVGPKGYSQGEFEGGAHRRLR